MTIQRQIRLSLDAGQARRRLNQLSDSARRSAGAWEDAFGDVGVGRVMDDLNGRLDGVVRLTGALGPGGVVGGAAVLGVAALGGAMAAAGASAYAWSKDQNAATNELVSFAAKLGVAVDEFDSLKQVADGSAEDLYDLIKDLSVKAAEGEDDFKRFGISVRGANKELLTGVPLLRRVADGISRIEDPTKQLVAADTLASDAGTKLVKVLRLTEDQIDAQSRALIDAGKVLDRDGAEATRRYADALSSLDSTIGRVQQAVGVEMAKAFEPAVQAIDEFIDHFSSEAGKRDIRAFFETILLGAALSIDAFLGMSKALEDTWQNFRSGMHNMTFGWVDEYYNVKEMDEFQQNWQDRLGNLADRLRVASRGAQAEIQAGLELKLKPKLEKPGEGKSGGGEAKERERVLAEVARVERSHLSELEQIQLEHIGRMYKTLALSGEEYERANEVFDADYERKLAKLNEAAERRTEQDRKKAESERARALAEVERQDRELASIFDLVRPANDDPAALVAAEEERKLAALEAGFQQELIARGEFERLATEISRQAAAERVEIEEQAQRETLQAVADGIDQWGGFAANLAGLSAEYASNRADAEVAALKRSGASEEQIAERKEQLAKEAFERDKQLRLASIAIDTAAGLLRAVATAPDILSGFAMAASVGIMGAAQAAVVAGTEYTGTSSAASSSRPDTSSSSRSYATANDTETTDRGGGDTYVVFNAPVSSRRAARELQRVQSRRRREG